jgi:predicted DCC family thiol-disulfide oxidoreductase YuxK
VGEADGHSAEDLRIAGRWLVLYDDDCGLCKWLLSGLLRWDHDHRLKPVALQKAAADELLKDLTPEQRMASWHLITPAGTRYSAGEALAPLLGLLPGGRPIATAFAAAPGLSERGYRWVADHRSQLSKLVPAGAKRRASDFVRARTRT